MGERTIWAESWTVPPPWKWYFNPRMQRDNAAQTICEALSECLQYDRRAMYVSTDYRRLLLKYNISYKQDVICYSAAEIQTVIIAFNRCERCELSCRRLVQTFRTLTFAYPGDSYPGISNPGPNLDPNPTYNLKLWHLLLSLTFLIVFLYYNKFITSVLYDRLYKLCTFANVMSDLLSLYCLFFFFFYCGCLYGE